MLKTIVRCGLAGLLALAGIAAGPEPDRPVADGSQVEARAQLAYGFGDQAVLIDLVVQATTVGSGLVDNADGTMVAQLRRCVARRCVTEGEYGNPLADGELTVALDRSSVELSTVLFGQPLRVVWTSSGVPETVEAFRIGVYPVASGHGGQVHLVNAHYSAPASISWFDECDDPSAFIEDRARFDYPFADEWASAAEARPIEDLDATSVTCGA